MEVGLASAKYFNPAALHRNPLDFAKKINQVLNPRCEILIDCASTKYKRMGGGVTHMCRCGFVVGEMWPRDELLPSSVSRWPCVSVGKTEIGGGMV